MFKICLKNYLCNLRYIFVALGVMFLALIIGAQAFTNKTVKEVTTMASSIKETTDDADLSLKRIGESVK